MKIQIVFTENKEAKFEGKAFQVEISCLPRINEIIHFDYIEEDDSFDELYEALAKFKSDEFMVYEVYHRCAINKLSEVSALLFVEPV